MIARAAADPSVDVSKMSAIMDMQERIMAKQAEIAFNQAMGRLQPRLPRITKQGRIEFGQGDRKQSTPFARYEDIMRAIGPLLSEEGFSISYGTEPGEKVLIVSARLSHSMGHSTTASMPLPHDTSGSKNAIQAMGSTVSYGKRYLLCAMLNIVCVGEDDDGEGSVPIDERMVNSILDMFIACDMDTESQRKFLSLMKVDKVEDILTKHSEKAMNLLRTKLREKVKRDAGKN